MADVKISQLPSATLPVAGTEVLPIVQSSVTSKVSISNILSAPNPGNVSFSGTGNRITGDFSNATVANRVMFQNSVANGGTTVQAIPNGTGNTAAWEANNASDATNSGGLRILSTTSDARVDANIRGTGAYVPMTFYTGGSERVRIDTAGNVGIRVIPNAWRSGQSVLQVGLNASFSSFDSGGTGIATSLISNTYLDSGNQHRYIQSQFGISYSQRPDLGLHTWSIAPTGTAGNVATYTEVMRIDSSGNVGIGTSSPSASAILDAQSTTKGVRMPNMTTTQKNAIASPAAGLMVFDTTLSKLSVYSGAAWQTITSV